MSSVITRHIDAILTPHITTKFNAAIKHRKYAPIEKLKKNSNSSKFNLQKTSL